MAFGVHQKTFFIILCLICFTKCTVKCNAYSAESTTGCGATYFEGQTAELNFFVAYEAFINPDFFAHLRNSLGTYIVICDRQSPVKCDALDSRYQTKDIVEDTFTLLIPNVTKELADTYVFQTFAAGDPKSHMACTLTVKVCDDGWYGESCKLRCGNCLQGASCDKKTGHCAACKPGFTLPFCKQVCDDGWYGESCKLRCTNCLHGESCDKKTGHCAACKPAFKPPFCRKGGTKIEVVEIICIIVFIVGSFCVMAFACNRFRPWKKFSKCQHIFDGANKKPNAETTTLTTDPV